MFFGGGRNFDFVKISMIYIRILFLVFIAHFDFFGLFLLFKIVFVEMFNRNFFRKKFFFEN